MNKYILLASAFFIGTFTMKAQDKSYNEITYRIQIGAFNKAVSDEVFAGVDNIILFTDKDGLVRYMTGLFPEYKNAIDCQMQMKERGFDDAFVVAYKNGERISLNVAIQSEQDKVDIGEIIKKDDTLGGEFELESKGFHKTSVLIDTNGEASNYVAQLSEPLIDEEEEVKVSETEVRNDNNIKKVAQPIAVTFIHLETGINLSQFDFSDSETTTIFTNGDYSPTQHQAIGLGFDLPNGLNLIVGAAYDKYQLMGKSLDVSKPHLSYDLNYVSASASLENNFPLKDKVSLLASGGMTYNYFLSGFQNIGAATYDLEDTDFQETSYSYTVGLALLYQCTDAMGVYLKYNRKNTLDMNEETYKIISYVYSIGARFNLDN